MAAPEPLELEEEALEEEPMGDEEATEVDTGIDPMFAADVSEAFPDLDDAQVAALQRAILGLTGGGAPPGGGMGGPPPMGF
jgi:hypothetical protein